MGAAASSKKKVETTPLVAERVWTSAHDILASLSLYSAVSRERVEREGSKKKEYDSVADEWVHQRVTESESDDESVEALTVRTPLQ